MFGPHIFYFFESPQKSTCRKKKVFIQKKNKLVTVLPTFDSVLGIFFSKFWTMFYENMSQLSEKQQLLSSLLRVHDNSGGIKRGWHLSKPLN